MSRAMNLEGSPEAVTDLCKRHSLRISTIEPLPSGGTRIVMSTSDDAASLRRHAKRMLIDGSVARSGVYMARPPIPYD